MTTTADNAKNNAAIASSDCNAWPLLSAEEITQRKELTPMWTIEEGTNGAPPKLVREFVCKNFQACLAFVNEAGAIAEERGHHPDMHLTGYRNIRIVVYSHGLQALTDNDFNLCKNIDETVKISYSPKWIKEHPECAASAA